MTNQADVWLPALEANQGALSLIALLFAIGWGLWEQHRANVAEERRQRRAITSVGDLIQKTFNLLLMWDVVEMPLGVLQQRLKLTSHALRDYAHTHAAMPEFAIVVLRASRMFELASEAASPTDLNGRVMRWAEKELESVKVELGMVLVQWDHDHAGPMKRLWLWLRSWPRRKFSVVLRNATRTRSD